MLKRIADIEGAAFRGDFDRLAKILNEVSLLKN